MIATTPKAPYYAVIFTSILSDIAKDYNKTAQRMVELAQQQKGFLGIESAREEIGITVSYWDSLTAIKEWKLQSEHTLVREKGRAVWYKDFKVRIAKIERDYEL